MTEAVLYLRENGTIVTHGSYSARRIFRYCPRQFKLERIDGWKQIEERASGLFGKCVESATQWHEECSRAQGAGAEKFVELWQRVGESPNAKNLTYTDCENDWAGLLRAGREMQQLYEIAAPSLPISTMPRARWQVKRVKKIFPGTELDVLDNVAYLDILSFPPWDHPMLVSLPNPTGADFRPLIIDCKTAGVDLNPKLVPLDPQLAEYAWQDRIFDVAFLWFTKHSHKLERKNRVTLLEDVGGLRAGTELFVVGVQKPEKPRRKKGDPEPTEPVSNEIERVFLGDSAALEAFKTATRGLHPSSNAYDMACFSFYQARFVVSCLPSQVTKQRLQFVAVRLDEEFVNEVGEGVGQDTVDMIQAHKTGKYRRTGGIRFPDAKCSVCAMRGICANDPEMRDSMLTRAGEEWFSGIDREGD